MARAIQSPLLTSISGSVGDLNFSDRRGSLVLSSKAPTKRLNSRPLQKHSMFLRQAAQDWINLSDDMKKYWSFRAKTDVIPPGITGLRGLTGRQYYYSWRLKCLHSYAECAYDLQPSQTLYLYQGPNMDVFTPGLDFNYYGYPAGSSPPWPRSCCWLSWSPDGRKKAGRRWFKIWPIEGHETARQCVDMDSLIYQIMGYPPELRPVQSQFVTQVAKPLITHWRVWSYGLVGGCQNYPYSVSTGQYYFRIPPLTPFFI